ncbi:MAG: T9SS type A sorting domain-containing protein, partial [Bacteroidales bacterium]|nr:T9SS type A sorting domain-containing protein [Bacteroidales bacterium]
FTPKSYQVFLGSEKVAENLTEKTYTFTNLKKGKYTAAVVAVYETGVSEKATIDFQISSTGVEGVSLLSKSYIYPNPSNGIFYLNTEVAGIAEVYSLTGKKIQHVVVPEAGTFAFDLQSEHGMYVVKFMAGGEVRYFKVVIR